MEVEFLSARQRRKLFQVFIDIFVAASGNSLNTLLVHWTKALLRIVWIDLMNTIHEINKSPWEMYLLQYMLKIYRVFNVQTNSKSKEFLWTESLKHETSGTIRTTGFWSCLPAFYCNRNWFYSLMIAPLQYPDKTNSRSTKTFFQVFASEH